MRTTASTALSIPRLSLALALLLPLLSLPLFAPAVALLDMPPFALPLTGDYDVLVVPLLVPTSSVLSLLPANVSSIQPSPLLDPPRDWLLATGLADEYDAALQRAGADVSRRPRPVWLQLGYQTKAGPGPGWSAALLKQDFHECKLEVPFLRHPLTQNKPEHRDDAFVFKGLVLFDSFLLSLADDVLPGLRSKVTSFSPPKTPTNYAADAAEVAYSARDFVEANATLEARDDGAGSTSGGGADGAFARTIQASVEMPWYGYKTGRQINQFKFDIANAQVPPHLYRVDVRLYLDRFADGSGSPSRLAAGDALVERKGALGVRSRSKWASTSYNV